MTAPTNSPTFASSTGNAEAYRRISMLASAVFLFVGVLFVIYAFAVLKGLGPFSERGTGGLFGDAFGALTSLFNALAFAGLLVTVRLQREDLKLQVHELRETRNVLSNQQAQLANQADAARKQVFEATFFRLLATLRETVNILRCHDGSSGTRAMHEWAVRLRDVNTQELRSPDLTPIGAAKVFQSWRKDNEYVLAPYFNLVQVILELVERSDRPDKILYVDVLRATMVPGELFLLFHFGLNNHEESSFKPIAEKYGLFESFRLETFDIPASRNAWYSARSVQRTMLRTAQP